MVLTCSTLSQVLANGSACMSGTSEKGHQSPSIRLELMSALLLIPEIWGL